MCTHDLMLKRQEIQRRKQLEQDLAAIKAKSTIDDGVVTILLKLAKTNDLTEMLNIVMSIEGYFKANNKLMIDQRLVAIVDAVKLAASSKDGIFKDIQLAEQSHEAGSGDADLSAKESKSEISDSVKRKSGINLVNAILLTKQIAELVKVFSSDGERKAKLASFSLEELLSLNDRGVFSYIAGFLYKEGSENFVPELMTLIDNLVNKGGTVICNTAEFLAIKQLFTYEYDFIKKYSFNKKNIIGVDLHEVIASINENRSEENPESALLELTIKKGKYRPFNFVTAI